jgi:hypothetical protein
MKVFTRVTCPKAFYPSSSRNFPTERNRKGRPDRNAIVTVAIKSEIDQACQTKHAACVKGQWKKA